MTSSSKARKKLPQVLRYERSERVARGEANNEVDRSGRRYVDEGAQRATGAAPEGGRSRFAAKGGDCPHSEGRGLHLKLQGHGRRGPQGYPDLFEVRRPQRGGHFKSGACVAP